MYDEHESSPHAERSKELQGLKTEVPVLQAFQEIGWPLPENIEEMLYESPKYRYVSRNVPDNERKGSGFLTATREFARSINSRERRAGLYLVRNREITIILPQLRKHLPELDQELGDLQREADVLLHNELEGRKMVMRAEEEKALARDREESNLSQYEIAISEAWSRQGKDAEALHLLEYRIDDILREHFPKGAPKEWFYPDPEKLELLKAKLRTLPYGDQLMGRMVLDIMDPVKHTKDLELPCASNTENIGTCTTAEIYFLDYVTHDSGYQRSDVVIDENNRPIMLFKRAGERSAMTLVETVLNGVRLPPGSLLRIEGEKKGSDYDHYGEIIPLAQLQGFAFLRLTTLAIPPEYRKNSVGNAYAFQHEQGMKGYDTLSIDDFMREALRAIDNPW